MESDNNESFSSPFYLLKSSEPCWKCRKSQRVVALASGEGEPFLLCDIRSMPAEFLAAILAVHPFYEHRVSQTADFAYFMNVCPCGAAFGDFYLFNKPGGAFFPTTVEEANKIEIHELPFIGEYDFVCSESMGTGGIIFQHGKRIGSPN